MSYVVVEIEIDRVQFTRVGNCIVGQEQIPTVNAASTI